MRVLTVFVAICTIAVVVQLSDALHYQKSKVNWLQQRTSTAKLSAQQRKTLLLGEMDGAADPKSSDWNTLLDLSKCKEIVVKTAADFKKYILDKDCYWIIVDGTITLIEGEYICGGNKVLDGLSGSKRGIVKAPPKGKKTQMIWQNQAALILAVLGMEFQEFNINSQRSQLVWDALNQCYKNGKFDKTCGTKVDTEYENKALLIQNNHRVRVYVHRSTLRSVGEGIQIVYKDKKTPAKSGVTLSYNYFYNIHDTLINGAPGEYSIHHNVFVMCRRRNPKGQEGVYLHSFNNVVVNFRDQPLVVHGGDFFHEHGYIYRQGGIDSCVVTDGGAQTCKLTMVDDNGVDQTKNGLPFSTEAGDGKAKLPTQCKGNSETSWRPKYSYVVHGTKKTSTKSLTGEKAQFKALTHWWCCLLNNPTKVITATSCADCAAKLKFPAGFTNKCPHT